MITKVIYIVPNAPHPKLAKVTEILSNLSGIEVELFGESLRGNCFYSRRYERIQATQIDT